MPEYLRTYVPDDLRASTAAGKPGSPIRFVGSTENVGRDGLVLDIDGWQLESYRSTPVVLFSHRYGDPPIGRAEKVWVEDRKLMFDVVFDEDEFSRLIEGKVRRGVLNTGSVGWDTLQLEPAKGDVPPRVTKQELLDFSIVPVPGDPAALAERQKRALADFGRDLLKLIEPEQDDTSDPAVPPRPTPTPTDQVSARASWDDTAAAMARLFRPYVQRPDAEREAEYRRLVRDYGRLKKTPPEFVPSADLEALDPADIRGLFLEGEPELLPALFAEWETRAGAVLNARNRQDIEEAISRLQAVLTRSKKEEQPAEPSDEERAAELLALFDEKIAGAP